MSSKKKKKKELNQEVQSHNPSSGSEDFSNPLPPQIIRASLTEGPLPPAHALQEYENVLPGLADRIVAMAEKEQIHQHEIEQRGLEGDINEARLGQIFALVIGLFTVFAGAYAGIKGAEITGSFIGAGGVAGLVTAFIYGRKGKNK